MGWGGPYRDPRSTHVDNIKLAIDLLADATSTIRYASSHYIITILIEVLAQ